MKFYLGTHCPSHVEQAPGVDWFLSRNRLCGRRSLPRLTTGSAVIDVAGFTALNATGEYGFGDREWAAEARRYSEEMGNIRWFPPRDWMCEPWIVRKTGLSVREHQRRTLASYLELRQIAPDLPWAPVLQGWKEGEYLEHADMYAAAGVDLPAAQIVGVGSVCRRQGTSEAASILTRLAGAGMRLHGFGVKTAGIQRVAHLLSSADSMAWSYQARRAATALPGCTHRKCANCLRYALRWRAALLASIDARLRMRTYDLFADAA